MSDPGHLPECYVIDASPMLCICDRLRVREARAREEQAIAELELREQTWLAALDAARDAVADLHIDGTVIREGVLNQALAAIESLRATP